MSPRQEVGNSPHTQVFLLPTHRILLSLRELPQEVILSGGHSIAPKTTSANAASASP